MRRREVRADWDWESTRASSDEGPVVGPGFGPEEDEEVAVVAEAPREGDIIAAVERGDQAFGGMGELFFLQCLGNGKAVDTVRALPQSPDSRELQFLPR